jgi:hypothetical protein
MARIMATAGAEDGRMQGDSATAVCTGQGIARQAPIGREPLAPTTNGTFAIFVKTMYLAGGDSTRNENAVWGASAGSRVPSIEQAPRRLVNGPHTRGYCPLVNLLATFIVSSEDSK